MVNNFQILQLGYYIYLHIIEHNHFTISRYVYHNFSSEELVQDKETFLSIQITLS